MTSQKLRRIVFSHYRRHGRHTLPWRTSHDPYRILVSEVMLQQTQVERVIPYFEAWMRRFPTHTALARSPLSRVLRAWQGLGYNRRAKHLHAAAKAIVQQGVFPQSVQELEKLPGVGPYTARAVAAFAWNEDTVFLETNIRTVLMHHCFPGKRTVSDTALRAVLSKAHPTGRAREWYSALMDYGSFLKRSGVRLNARTKHYTKQKAFKGSSREARGALLKALVRGPRTATSLASLLGPSRRLQLTHQLAVLTEEGMVEHKQGKYRLPR